jgi:FkbM family methyltransferase
VKLNTTIKNAIKQLANTSVALTGGTALGRYLYAQIVSNAMNRTQKVTHRGSNLIFSVPNALSKFRADSFSIKEPETLEWIDGIRQGSILWDIGANVGIYTCYAAKARGCRVFAFEPSVFNLELLARNIFLNDLTKQVTIVPLPLSDELTLSTLNMTSTAWGGALSTFGQSYGHDGEAIRKVFEIPTIGLSMVDAIKFLRIPQPDFIKMDVDGIEHLILKGGVPVLLAAKSVLIEINDAFPAQAEAASKYLQDAGYWLEGKRHADYLDSHAGAARFTFNQIWVK